MSPRTQACLQRYAAEVSKRTGRRYMESAKWARWIGRFVIRCLRAKIDPEEQIDRLLVACTESMCNGRFGLPYPPAEFLPYGATLHFPKRATFKGKSIVPQGDIHDLLNLGLINPASVDISNVNLHQLTPSVRDRLVKAHRLTR